METSSEAKAIKKLPIQYNSESPQAPPQFDINKLEIAEGLKQLLLNKGCDLNFLLQTEPATLAHQLGIDEYVANLIIRAAKETSAR
jgi:hypothetical protein